ncbi:phenylalanine--tRNA ligase subunit beta [Halanaerobium hydrogeniformans]|uniref:Phenylalanine--tRNA ligase beta subunit n=1 Tax=Halanaerobium hydrogeniformans TaxID=656519 RepID=E4RLI1_HALHG|nr:phenylalanine--tRNA ligase subunit beta [Halanaerobium hydrogeniformans]ADQ14895.1 phenylalanyl-tRNA synthetase, beta subunit [Halanaerobium hydrogeniformans]
MQISYNWLKKYININFSAEDLSEKLTMAGLEVEALEYLGQGLEDIIIAEITKIKEHPNADKLQICYIRTEAGDEEIPVVTGAPNVEEGQKVPFAGVGSSLPGGMEIEEVKLRGEISKGMICSADELGLQEERAAGIMVLDSDAPLGLSFIKYMKLDDYIYKLDLTPNYARCLGMLGVAREIKSLYAQDKELIKPTIQFNEDKNETHISEQVEIEIKDPDLCPRYSARLIKDVEIKESPDWIQRRLKAAGIRPINNVVDITNFVLMEYNQPLHSFDYNKIKDGKIIVRRAEKGETITTLDEEQRLLDDEMLVIADPDEAVAVAGVMGGFESEVTAQTTDVLIESAYFNPVSVRKTAKKLGMHSDASHRFERGVDIEKAVEANNRACQLLEKCAGGTVVPGVIDEYPGKYEPAVIELDCDRVNELLGVELEESKIIEILKRLQFSLEKKEDKVLVTVPSFRTDVSRGADLVEEIARVYGYNEIESSRPVSKQRGKRTAKQNFEKDLKELLNSGGLDEVITYSLQAKKGYQDLNLTQVERFNNFVEIKNPLSAAFGILRTTLIPGLIDVLASNARRQGAEMAVFETGTVFRKEGDNKRPLELNKLGGGLFGAEDNLWQQDAPNFYQLKGVLEMLFEHILLEDYHLEFAEQRPYLHPGRKANIIVEGHKLGFIGEIHPELAEKNDLPQGTTIFEMDLDKLFELSKDKSYHYKQITKYPVLDRDLAVVIKEDIAIGEIYQAIKSEAGAMLKELNLFDIYQGDQIKSGYKSAAFELKFQAEDRTLRDEEVNERFNKIVDHLSEQYSAEIRGN